MKKCRKIKYREIANLKEQKKKIGENGSKKKNGCYGKGKME